MGNYFIFNNNQKHKLITLLLLDWFFPTYLVFGKMIYDEQKLSWILYFAKCIMLLFAFFINRKIDKKFIRFISIYIVISIVNCLLVSYKYYVFVDAFTNLIKFMTPVYIISNLDDTSVDELLKRWYIWSIVHSALLLPIYFLVNLRIVDYGDVATVTVSNIIILLIGLYEFKHYKVVGGMFFVLNYIVLLIYGSRMPPIAVIFSFIYLYIFGLERQSIKKLVFTIGLSIIAIIIVFNMQNILEHIIEMMEINGIESRTISLFSAGWGSISFMKMAESSGRGETWELAFNYIKQHYGFPCGFGVIRELTDGKRYYSHNLLSDLGIMFGFFSIPLLICIIKRIQRFKKSYSEKTITIVLTCGVFFLVCSMTGAYFLSDAYAVIFWGMLFFLRLDRGKIRS